METERKIEILTKLGSLFNELSHNKYFEDVLVDRNEKEFQRYERIQLAQKENSWFTNGSIQKVFVAWANSLKKEKIETWISKYSFESLVEKKLGLILAGNIPLVGLHDILSGLVSDYQLHIKPSSKDLQLISLVIAEMKEISPEWNARINIVDKLNDIDVLIATGSNNSARYFEYYFRDIQKIIRKNRTSIAVLSEDNTEEELKALGEDIFTHFGLGCRNVTKLYLPKGFDLDRFFGAIYHYQDIVNHNKYANNYDYNKAVYLMNKIELIENGFLLLKEDEALHSPIGVLFYEFYDDLTTVKDHLNENEEVIQAIVSKEKIEKVIPFGEAQKPELWDYADGLDTIEFLLESKG